MAPKLKTLWFFHSFTPKSGMQIKFCFLVLYPLCYSVSPTRAVSTEMSIGSFGAIGRLPNFFPHTLLWRDWDDIWLDRDWSELSADRYTVPTGEKGGGGGVLCVPGDNRGDYRGQLARQNGARSGLSPGRQRKEGDGLKAELVSGLRHI